jgi:RiboL-PSP-HEPN
MDAIETRAAELQKYIASLADKSLPEETKAYLIRFGTVLICGYVERAIEIIVLTRLTKKAHPRVLSFVQSHFKRGRNMDCEAIGQLLNRFDASWYRAFLSFVDANADVKEGISSCYSVRNSVAHGGTGSLGANRLNELLELSSRLIDGIKAATN